MCSTRSIIPGITLPFLRLSAHHDILQFEASVHDCLGVHVGDALEESDVDELGVLVGGKAVPLMWSKSELG
jgi:hypothetical protein